MAQAKHIFYMQASGCAASTLCPGVAAGLGLRNHSPLGGLDVFRHLTRASVHSPLLRPAEDLPSSITPVDLVAKTPKLRDNPEVGVGAGLMAPQAHSCTRKPVQPAWSKVVQPSRRMVPLPGRASPPLRVSLSNRFTALMHEAPVHPADTAALPALPAPPEPNQPRSCCDNSRHHHASSAGGQR